MGRNGFSSILNKLQPSGTQYFSSGGLGVPSSNLGAPTKFSFQISDEFWRPVCGSPPVCKPFAKLFGARSRSLRRPTDQGPTREATGVIRDGLLQRRPPASFADQAEGWFLGGVRDSDPPAMTAPYLATLNAEQQQAVEHGVHNPSPLLIIAGAGSGKTNTLAHRVAHLIVQGADPRRIMLLTFSRRAAVEMSRRVERIWSSSGRR
jgi:hypothetical protein